MIGISLADQSLFPVFTDEEPGRKRVLLIPALPEQNRVLLHFYRFSDATGADREPLQQLELENINPETVLSLVAGLDHNGTLSVEVVDERDGHGVSASIPDVVPDLDHRSLLAGPPIHDEERYTDTDESAGHKKRRWIPFLVAILVLTAALVIGLRSCRHPAGTPVGQSTNTTAEQPIPEAPSENPSAEAAPAPVQSAAEQPTQEPPATERTVTDEPPVESVTTNPPRPLHYQIIRGDTLWDISTTRYGTPWLYPWLAEENAISDPDFILADDYLTIPETPSQE